jgi:peptide-methionine (R)-S-oxide reductase
MPDEKQPGASCHPAQPSSCGTEHWRGRSQAEWRRLLTPEQFQIARQAGTERAFTGKYWNSKTKGVYACACCAQPLFRSEAKFDSGTGWPSYFQPIQPDAVITHRDGAHGMVRTEVRCAQCDAHLGHVFDDGPPPTGLRYCINSACLNLVEDQPR